MSEPDVEMNYDDELDFGLDGLFEDEPPAEEAVLAPAAAAAEPAEPEQPEPLVPVLALRALARAKQSQSQKKVRSTRVGVCLLSCSASWPQGALLLLMLLSKLQTLPDLKI